MYFLVKTLMLPLRGHVRAVCLCCKKHFWEDFWAPMDWNVSTCISCKFQKKRVFLFHVPHCLNMVEKWYFPLWERSIWCNFQNASPRKCSGHFPANFTQLKYYWVLQTGRVSASVLIRTPLAMTCEHGVVKSRNFGVNMRQFSKCISAEVLWPFSEKLHPVKLLKGTTNWSSISFCTHSHTTCHDLWTRCRKIA